MSSEADAYGGASERAAAAPERARWNAASLQHALVPTLVGAGTLAAVAGLAAPQGSYFPTAWGWAAFALAAVAAVVLVLRPRVEIAWPGRVFVLALVAFVGWVGLSLLWTANPSATAFEIERDLVFVAAAVVFLAVVTRDRVDYAVAGILGGITVISVYSLGTRLFPGEIGPLHSFTRYRLFEPIGYWNALGLFAGMGALLAANAAITARRVAVRAAAGAVLVPLMLTLYFTFGRNAWYSLAVGLVVAVVVAPDRLRRITGLALIAPAPVAAIWIASRAEGLTHQNVTLEQASRDGERLALLLLVLVPLGALGAVVFAALERHVGVPRPLRLAYGGLLLAAVAAVVAAGVIQYGGPADAVSRAYEEFRGPPRGGENLNQRLFSLSSNGRVEAWRVAWHNYREHPALGSGAGTYEEYWLEHRPFLLVIRDAHNLYIEVLSELGPVGLGLLVCALAVPLVAFVRARQSPLAVGALSAYAAFVVHAGGDWDWELTAVTVAGLFCGLVILVIAGGDRPRAVPSVVQWVAGGIAVAIACFSLVVAVGNGAAAASSDADDRGNYLEAERQAQRATRWVPWSAAAWQSLGHAQLGLDDREGARSSLLKAVELAPRDWSVWYDLGTASDGAEQRRAYERAAELNPLSQNVQVLRTLRLLPPLPKKR